MHSVPTRGFGEIELSAVAQETGAFFLVRLGLGSGRYAGIVLLKRGFFRSMEIVQGARKRCVWLERVDVKHPRIIATRQNEFCRFLGQEGGLRVLDRDPGGEVTRERVRVLCIVGFI